MTIEAARSDIDFIDYTTRSLTILVRDSGDFEMPGRGISISGDNGQATGVSAAGGNIFTLNPGIYTVRVPGALAADGGESEEVDLTGTDGTVTLTIPVPIVLSITRQNCSMA